VILEFFEDETLPRTGHFLELIWPELLLVVAPECSGVERSPACQGVPLVEPMFPRYRNSLPSMPLVLSTSI
jgi:hypothetical protein